MRAASEPGLPVLLVFDADDVVVVNFDLVIVKPVASLFNFDVAAPEFSHFFEAAWSVLVSTSRNFSCCVLVSVYPRCFLLSSFCRLHVPPFSRGGHCVLFN